VVGTRRADAGPEDLTNRCAQVCLRWRPSATGRAWLWPTALAPRAGYARARAAPARRHRGRGVWTQRGCTVKCV